MHRNGRREKTENYEKYYTRIPVPKTEENFNTDRIRIRSAPAGGEEIITSTDPVEVVKSLSTQKAAAVKEELEPQLPENWLVIGADTIVVYDGKILGKPKDGGRADRVLRMLQGQTHSVYTGVTLLEEGKQTTFAEETKVTMYPLMTEEEIAWYVAARKSRWTKQEPTGSRDFVRGL